MMGPIIQKDELNFNKENKEKRIDKRPDSLICRVKYTNTLPDIPFDPKFLQYSFGNERFIKYNPTSLERNYKHDLLTEHDVGVEVDLIDPLVFQINSDDKLHPDDEKLLEDDAPNALDARRSRHHNRYVSWMRKTEYISNEHSNKYTKTDKSESRIAYQKRLLKDDDVYRDRQSQIDAIESTFSAAKEPLLKHYSKPNVVAKSIYPILPDFKLWKHPCAQVIFDDNPIGRNKGDGKDSFNRALIRGMVDESGQHFVAYFLPTESTKNKLKRDAEDDVLFTQDEIYEYYLAREYNWNVKNKGMTNYEENYFVVFRDDGAYYNELETRVRLNKRRKIGSNVGTASLKTKLLVKHREFNDMEFKAQADRLSMLEQEIDDDDVSDGDDNQANQTHNESENFAETKEQDDLSDTDSDNDIKKNESGNHSLEESDSDNSIIE